MTGTEQFGDRRYRVLHRAHRICRSWRSPRPSRAPTVVLVPPSTRPAAELLEVESHCEMRALRGDDEDANRRIAATACAAAAAGRATRRCPWRYGPLRGRARAWRRDHRPRVSRRRMRNPWNPLTSVSLRRSAGNCGPDRYTALVQPSMKIFADSALSFISERPDAHERERGLVRSSSSPGLPTTSDEVWRYAPLERPRTGRFASRPAPSKSVDSPTSPRNSAPRAGSWSASSTDSASTERGDPGRRSRAKSRWRHDARWRHRSPERYENDIVRGLEHGPRSRHDGARRR